MEYFNGRRCVFFLSQTFIHGWLNLLCCCAEFIRQKCIPKSNSNIHLFLKLSFKSSSLYMIYSTQWWRFYKIQKFMGTQTNRAVQNRGRTIKILDRKFHPKLHFIVIFLDSFSQMKVCDVCIARCEQDNFRTWLRIELKLSYGHSSEPLSLIIKLFLADILETS